MFNQPFKQKILIWLGKPVLAACGTGQIKSFNDSARSIYIITKFIGVPTKQISNCFDLAMQIRHLISVAGTLMVSIVFTANANKTVRASLRVMRTKLWKGDISKWPRPSARFDDTQKALWWAAFIPRLKHIKKASNRNKDTGYLREKCGLMDHRILHPNDRTEAIVCVSDQSRFGVHRQQEDGTISAHARNVKEHLQSPLGPKRQY